MAIDTSQLNSLPPQNDDDLSSLIGGLPMQYELLGRVTSGGMGSIFKVRNRFTGAVSAIKVLNSDAARNREALSRFVIEAKAAHSLKHPNICRVSDFAVTEEGKAYLVMDWIDGIDLDRKINQDRRIPPKDAIPIFQQIASGLAYAHQNNLVHRDVKPQNIMLSQDKMGRSEVHIVDFGIAKVIDEEDKTIRGQGLTRVGMVVGTPLFMSPEQATGAKVDNRSGLCDVLCPDWQTAFCGRLASRDCKQASYGVASGVCPCFESTPGPEDDRVQSPRENPGRSLCEYGCTLDGFEKIDQGSQY